MLVPAGCMGSVSLAFCQFVSQLPHFSVQGQPASRPWCPPAAPSLPCGVSDEMAEQYVRDQRRLVELLESGFAASEQVLDRILLKEPRCFRSSTGVSVTTCICLKFFTYRVFFGTSAIKTERNYSLLRPSVYGVGMWGENSTQSLPKERCYKFTKTYQTMQFHRSNLARG